MDHRHRKERCDRKCGRKSSRRKMRSGTFGARRVDTVQLGGFPRRTGRASRESARRTLSPRGRRHVDVLWRRKSSWKPARSGFPSDTARAATSDEVKDLRREAQALKEVVADLTSRTDCSKSMIGDRGRRGMRYHASDKTEIIRLVEQWRLPAGRTLEKPAVPDRLSTAGMIGIGAADRRLSPITLTAIGSGRIQRLYAHQVDLALDQPELSPRELAVRFPDRHNILSRRPRSIGS